MKTIVRTSLFLGVVGAALFLARRAMGRKSTADAVSPTAEPLTAPLGEVAHRVG